MAVTRYSLVAHDWLNLEYIINDLTRRVVTQNLGPTSSPTFEDVTITGLSGTVISSESVETSIEELDTALATLGDGSQYLLLDGTRAMEGDLDMDGNNIDNCGTVDASAGTVLTTDGGTSIPGSESDGYVGVAQIDSNGRLYFYVEGRRYYVQGREVLEGTPIGLGLLFTYATDAGLSDTLSSLTVTDCCVLGANSAVFQPGTDATNFFEIKDADGGTNVVTVDTSNERLGVGTDAPSLKFDVKGSPNTTFTNCPLLMQVHTTDAYADGMGGGISLGGMYDGTHSTTFGYIAGLKDGAAESDTAGKLVLGARPTGGGGVDMTVMTIYGTGITCIGDGGTTNYFQISSTGDVTFNGSAGFYPVRLSQSAQPTPDTGELIIWRDSDDSKTYLVYQDTDEGTRKVELT